MTDSSATGPHITADAIHEPVTAPPGLPGPVHRFGPLLLLAAFGFALYHLIRALNHIPNSAEEHQRLNAFLITIIAALGLFLLAGPVISSRWAPLARGHRFTGWAIGLGVLFWWLPVPFFLGRILTWILLYACAAVYIALTLRIALLPKRGPAPIPALSPWWAAGAAIAATLLALLSDKQNSLAFSTAID